MPQIDKMAPAMERAEGTTSTKTLKWGKSLENPKNRKGNELRTSSELEGRVLRWGLIVSRGPIPAKDWGCHFKIRSDFAVSTESACGTKVSVVSDTHIIGTTISPLSCTWTIPQVLIPWVFTSYVAHLVFRPSSLLIFSLLVLQTHGSAAWSLTWHLFWPSWLV